jgi:hypothetical protein
MMRVCVFGNSQSAALKLAYDADSSIARRMQLTFFALRGNKLRGLRVRGRVIEPATPGVRNVIAHTSGGLTEIDPSRYDAFFVLGLGVHAYRPPPTFFSQAARLQAVLDRVSDSVALYILDLLAEVGAAPVFAGHEPLLSSSGPQTPGRHPNYEAGIALLNAAVFAPRNVTLLEQPPETVVDGWNTARRLSLGSRGLDTGDKFSGRLHDDDDYAHMNQEYGRIYLEMMEERLLAAARPCAADDVAAAPFPAATDASSGSALDRRAFG